MRQTFSLILLLAIGLSLLIVYAFLPKDNIIVEMLSLQQLNVSSLIMESEDSAMTDSLEKVAEYDDVLQVDSAPQRVLLIGDSMCERLRNSLAGWCNANDHQLTSVVWYSSSSKIWAETDTLDYFINIAKPTHIFICLGGNELYVRDLDNRDQYIKTIKRKCSGIPTVWIGPPNWCKDTGINALIEKNMGKYAYYPSLNLDFERASDGHHVTQRSADNWMDAVVEWIKEGKSVHPFLLCKPRVNVSSHKTFVLSPPEQNKGKKENAAEEETEENESQELNDTVILAIKEEGEGSTY